MKVIRQNALYGLSVMLLGIPGISTAQEVAPLPPLPPMTVTRNPSNPKTSVPVAVSE